MSFFVNINDVCLCPLHTPVFEHLDIRWFPYETEEPIRRRICSRRPTGACYVNGTIAPPIPQPFIFELIGCISQHDCHLTANGYGNRTEAPVASCWIVPCTDRISQIEWAESAHAIHHLLNSICGAWDADALVVEDNPLHYQLFYEPLEGDSLREMLPVYRENGQRLVPLSLSEVPFGRTMRFMFTIHYFHNLSIHGPRMVYAELYSAQCL